jgi:hypothetical protein
MAAPAAASVCVVREEGWLLVRLQFEGIRQDLLSLYAEINDLTMVQATLSLRAILALRMWLVW